MGRLVRYLAWARIPGPLKDAVEVATPNGVLDYIPTVGITVVMAYLS